MEHTYDITGLPNAANAVLSSISGKTLLFYGDMGVGKTALIKEIAKQLGFLENVSSPTFSLVNEYPIEDGVIYHFDFYRLDNEKEALDFGVEEYFYSKNWKLIEWPEKIEKLLPDTKNEIFLTKNMDGTRTLKIKAGK